MSDPHASRRRRQAVRHGRALIRTAHTVDDLITALAADRQRGIRILEVPLTGTSPSGAWVPAAQRDYLLCPAGASSTRRTAVLCHEISHILLGHDPALHSSLTPALLGVLAPSLPLQTAQRVLLRTGYTNREEAAAEHVGTMLASALGDRARAASWESSSRLSARLR